MSFTPLLAVADTEPWQWSLGLVCIIFAVWGIVRQIDVRLVLFLTAIALGGLAGHAELIFVKFYETFTDEKFVIPICTAMGFAYVLKLTGCDRHLVFLLVHPLKKVHFLLIPGTVIVGFLVNMPIVSQTSTAVTIGTVLIPVLIAARIPKATIGAALLLGSSVGGELFNPGAPEFLTTITGSEKAAVELLRHPERLKNPETRLDSKMFTPKHCVSRLAPLNFLSLGVATAVFWAMSRRREGPAEVADEEVDDGFRVNYLKALIPIVPIALLYLTSSSFGLLEVPRSWLVRPGGAGSAETRMIGMAMLLGCAIAALVSWRQSLGVADAFFQGAGYGFTHIISLIVIANCFGEGLTQIGFAKAIGEHLGDNPNLLMPVAGYLSLGFAVLCGSGMATAQSLFGFFAEPSLIEGIDPASTGAVVSLAAAAGRTMSPVSAVALMSAKMTETSVFTLVKLVTVPLLVSTTAVILAAMLLAPPP